MTDTGPATDPGTIDVYGQTARGPSPYANLQWPSGKVVGDGPPVEVVDEGDPGEGPAGGERSDEEKACGDPDGRKRWNADAKAAEAVQQLINTALQRYSEDLQNREFGALICQFSDGSVDISPISDGGPILDANGNAISYPLGRPSVGVPPGACVNGTPLGFIHSHPGVNAGIPSQDDFVYAQYLVDYFGADAATVGIFTVASHLNPNNGSYAYRASRAGLGEKAASQAQGYQPAWVNPDAKPCQGS